MPDPKDYIRASASFFFLFISLFLPGCTPDPVNTDLLLFVDFSNVPENMVLTDFHTDKIEIRVQARPGQIEAIHGKETRYTVDLYTDLAYDPAGDTVSIEPGEYLIPVETERIPMPPGIKVLDTNPSYLSVKLEKKISRWFKIRVPYTGQPAKGHRVLDAATEPAGVELTGAFSVIQSINELRTTPVDLTDVSESFKKKIPIDPNLIAAVSIPDPIVTVSVPVQEILTFKTIQALPIEVRNAEGRVTVEPPQITIRLKGPFETIGDRNLMDRIHSFIDLQDMKPGVYARHAYIDIPVGLMMTQASPQVFTVKIE